MHEIELGDRATGIRPGLIGEIGVEKGWVSPVEERTHRAAGQAAAATGLPVLTHSVYGSVGLEQLTLLELEGCDPARVAIGHADTNLDLRYLLAIVERGAWVMFDSLLDQRGRQEERSVELVAELASAGTCARSCLRSMCAGRAPDVRWRARVRVSRGAVPAAIAGGGPGRCGDPDADGREPGALADDRRRGLAMTGLARTVLGDVDPSGWGVTLVHEHLIVDWGELQGKPKLRFEFEDGVSQIAARLTAARADGVGGLGECTPIGTGRYADVMVEASRRSGVAIVGATGFFHEGWTPMHPIARALDVDALTDLYVREITEGMGATTVRAGLIKCATGQDAIPPDEEKLLRATARAHRATGRTDRRAHHGLDGGRAARHLRVRGRRPVRGVHLARRRRRVLGGAPAGRAAPRRERLGRHDHVRLRAGRPADGRGPVALDAGFGSQVMLAHDALVLQSGPEQMFGVGPNDFGYIPRVFVPKLIASGVDEATAWAMVRENPQRFLARFSRRAPPRLEDRVRRRYPVAGPAPNETATSSTGALEHACRGTVPLRGPDPARRRCLTSTCRDRELRPTRTTAAW